MLTMMVSLLWTVLLPELLLMIMVMLMLMLQNIGTDHADVIGVGGIVALAVVDDIGDDDSDVVTEDWCLPW